MRTLLLSATSAAALAFALVPAAQAATFVNGGFEDGDASSWTVGEGFRGGITNTNLSPATIGAGNLGHSSIITAGTVDPRQGVSLGSTVYQGNYSWRAEDTNTGGYASYIQQTVLNYTDPDIFFEWKAVLLGAHGPEDSATMKIILRDLTTGTDVITRNNNATAGGADPAAFTYDPSTNNFYTPNWQIEHLDVAGLGLTGHDFLLTVIGSDCSPTAHWGYVYLDGFAGVIVNPHNGVPEPASLALLGAGVLGLAAARRKRR